ncbi:MAG: putative TonB-dependent receptor [Chitinophagaceae bacterium]|nr:putative TonB-dependent receptor [Chitinophagaceae bacterium]
MFAAKAQTAQVSGKVKEETGLPIEMANITLLTLPDSIPVNTISTDSSGYYVFNKVNAGSYTLVVFHLGFKKYVSPVFTLKDSDNKSMQDLLLVSESNANTEVVVTGRKPVVTQEADKMVVNVENMMASSGLSAIDILKRSPGISVNSDGIITLKGKTGVLVMLDDKPLYMSAEQVGNLLKAIPSDQIKSIEIITSPSAKYDAAGTAGIINIKLKSGAYEGFNGTANMSYGQGVYHKANVGTTISYKKKKLSLNSSYQYNNRISLFRMYADRQYNDPSNSVDHLDFRQYYRLPQQTHAFTLKAGYDITDKTNVSFDLIGNYNEYGWDGASNTAQYDHSNSLINTSESTDYGVYAETNYNLNAGITHKLDTLGSQLSGGINYTRYTGISNKKFETENFDANHQNDGNPFLYVFRDPSYTNQFSAKVDYIAKVSEKLKIESGVKVNHQDKFNPATIMIVENGVSSDVSNPFKYNENITAAYAIVNRSLGKKWKLQAGLRMERTDIKGNQTRLDTSFTRDYTNLFPSGNITFAATEKTSYTLLYSRRIQRPTSFQLNPVLSITDPYNSWGGNAFLLPEYTDNIELSQSLFSGYVVTTLNYSYTRQPIAWGLTVDSVSLKSVNKTRNLEYKQNVGLSVAVNMPITKWWTTSVYVYGYNNRFVGDLGYGRADNSQWALDFNSTQSFTLSKKMTAEISGVYESPWAYGLNRIASQGQLNLAVQRKIWASKASVKLALSDVFWSDRWKTSNKLNAIDAHSLMQWDTRVVMLTFNYKFGNVVHRL